MPAYDIVSTVQYLPSDDTIALNLAGEKNVAQIGLESFVQLGRNAGIPLPHRLAREARETVTLALDSWPKELPNLPLDSKHQRTILDRLERLQIARQCRKA